MTKVPTGKIGDDVQHLTSELKKYAENKVKLAILNIVERLSQAIADSTGKIMAGLFLFVAFLYLLIALALFVGNILHNLVLGFVVASGPGLFAALFIYILVPAKMTHKMQDKIVEKVINDVDVSSESVIKRSETDEHPSTNEKTVG
jgi:hypothetical protein